MVIHLNKSKNKNMEERHPIKKIKKEEKINEIEIWSRENKALGIRKFTTKLYEPGDEALKSINFKTLVRFCQEVPELTRMARDIFADLDSSGNSLILAVDITEKNQITIGFAVLSQMSKLSRSKTEQLIIKLPLICADEKYRGMGISKGILRRLQDLAIEKVKEDPLK